MGIHFRCKRRINDRARGGIGEERSTRSTGRSFETNHYSSEALDARRSLATESGPSFDPMIESNSREMEIVVEKDSSCVRSTSGTFVEDEPSSTDSLVDRKRKTRGSLREIGWDKSKRMCSEKETKDEIKSSPIHRMREYCRLHNALFTRDKDVAGLIYKFNMKQVKSYLVESLETDLETVLSIVPWGIPRGKYAALARAINFVIGRAHPDASQVTEEEARRIVVPTRVGYEVRFQVLSDLVRCMPIFSHRIA